MTAIQFLTRRRRLFKNQYLAAEALGVSRTTVTEWETGRNPVPRWAILFMECLEGRAAAVQ